MPCGSTVYIPANHIETASPSCLDLGWSRQMPLSWLAKIAAKTALGLERRHQRRDLLGLDDRILADIGISREQAVEEALKSSWAHILMWQLHR